VCETQRAPVAYSSARSGSTEVWVTASDESGQPGQLTDLGRQAHVDSWSPDRRTLSLHHHGKGGAVNILMLCVDGVEQKPQVLLEREIAVGRVSRATGTTSRTISAQTDSGRSTSGPIRNAVRR
jgi:Tol biopolymer transport system component